MRKYSYRKGNVFFLTFIWREIIQTIVSINEEPLIFSSREAWRVVGSIRYESLIAPIIMLTDEGFRYFLVQKNSKCCFQVYIVKVDFTLREIIKNSIPNY